MKTSSAVTAGHRSLEDGRIYKLALTGLFAALSYVVFTFLQIKITLPGGDATSIHLGNAVCVLGALILGGFYGGLGGALGMTIGDLFDPIYVVYAPKTFLLKLCIGLWWPTKSAESMRALIRAMCSVSWWRPLSAVCCST